MAGPLGYSGGNFAVPPIEVTLAGAQAFQVPSGQYLVQLGRYTTIEWLDGNSNTWRAANNISGNLPFDSDGTNYRLINRTGTPVGAILTNLGSSYTTAPTVTVSTGGSVWQAILGGALNTTITTATAGTYNYIPTIIFPPPPDGGFQATATAALSGAGLGTVTMVNRGAGYTAAPTGSIAIPASQMQNYLGTNQGNNILIVQDPRDTATGGAVLTISATLANTDAVTAIICTDPGTTALTALPTLTISGGAGGGAAATVLMNWTVTGFTVVANGSSYGTSLPFVVTGAGLFNHSTDATGDVNPQINLGLTKPRNFWIEGTTTSGGNITATAALTDDAGWGIQRVPDTVIISTGVPTVVATATATVGATSDTSYLQMLKL